MCHATQRCILLGLVLATWRPAPAVPVDLKLILAQDVSRSVDSTEFGLSRTGYEAAFRSHSVISAIEGGEIGAIAVTLWDFASTHSVAVDWTLINDVTTSNAFADAVAAAPRGSVGNGDSHSNLIAHALAAISNKTYQGTRSVLDIAADSPQTVREGSCSYISVDCSAARAARDAFLAGDGTTINAVWLNNGDFFGLDPSDLVNAFWYGSLNVIGGPGSFQMFAPSFKDFSSAIEGKVVREIETRTVSEVPEPGTLSALGGGLLLVFVFRKRPPFERSLTRAKGL